ncbi:hypothetical protein Tco_0582132, partial [Tanacetum coccineum]
MDLEIAQTTTTSYDMWRLRIEQYFQVQDYALWDVIENGNSFKLLGLKDFKMILRVTTTQ